MKHVIANDKFNRHRNWCNFRACSLLVRAFEQTAFHRGFTAVGGPCMACFSCLLVAPIGRSQLLKFVCISALSISTTSKLPLIMQ